MRKEDLYRKIKDRNALSLFEDIQRELNTAKASGTIVHGLPGLKEVFSKRRELYRLGAYPKEETIEDYRKRDEKKWEFTRDEILKAINEVGIKI